MHLNAGVPRMVPRTPALDPATPTSCVVVNCVVVTCAPQEIVRARRRAARGAAGLRVTSTDRKIFCKGSGGRGRPWPPTQWKSAEAGV